jgi:biotin carboxyl carrier protein
VSAERLRLSVSGPAELAVQLPAGGRPINAEAAAVAEAVDEATDEATDDPIMSAAIRPQARLLHRSPADAAAGRLRAEVVVGGWCFVVVAEDARRATLRETAARAAAAHHGVGHATVRALIPGRITRVWVSVGEDVEQGQRLLAIDAMKMENEIRAQRAGTVEMVAVAVGDVVELNDELLTIGQPAVD